MHLLDQTLHESKVYFTLNDDKKVKRSVSSHPFNRSVTITYPSNSTINLPQLEAQYFCGNLILSDILKDEFYLALHHKKVTFLSTSRIDGQDSLCFHMGVLRLSLTKDTYQKAGLEGQKSKLSPNKFNVAIDFTAKEFSTTKLFKRLKLSFDTVFEQPIEVLLQCEQSSILPNGFTEMSNVVSQFTEIHQIPQWSKLSLIPPKESSNEYEVESFNEFQEDVLTHLALFTIPATIPDSSDPYITTYQCPFSVGEQSITSTTITGVISVQYLERLLSCVSQLSDDDTWTALQIRGFEHTPMAWIGSEHGYLVGGENAITILSFLDNAGAQKNDVMQVDESRSEPRRHLVMWEVVGARDSYS